MKAKFKIGDRVVALSEGLFTNEREGAVGTVVSNKNGYDCYCVKFDKEVTTLSDLHYSWCAEDNLELVDERNDWKVIIIPDGDKTTATLYVDNRLLLRETVTRYSKDTYDHNIAIHEVVKKLTGISDVKPCVESAGQYKEIKIEPKFKVGDIVKCSIDSFIGSCVGRPVYGVVKYVDDEWGTYEYSVECEESVSRFAHNCNGNTKHKRGTFVLESEMELVLRP